MQVHMFARQHLDFLMLKLNLFMYNYQNQIGQLISEKLKQIIKMGIRPNNIQINERIPRACSILNRL